MFLDRLDPQRPVASHAGQDDGDGPFLLIFRQMAEKQVDRRPRAAWSRGLMEMQHAVEDRHIFVRWNDMETVRKHGHAFFGLHDGHERGTAQDIRHHALMRGIEMRDQHEPEPAVHRHVGEELLERLQGAG